MESISLADAKARLSELVGRAEAGESLTITRRGKPAARLVAVDVPLQPIDLENLRRLRAKTPVAGISAVEIIRDMRDGRY